MTLDTRLNADALTKDANTRIKSAKSIGECVLVQQTLIAELLNEIEHRESQIARLREGLELAWDYGWEGDYQWAQPLIAARIAPLLGLTQMPDGGWDDDA